MADLTIKRGDTWPPLAATLTDEEGPIDLTTATTITLILKSQGQSPVTIEGVCDVVSAAAGTVKYEWEASDTNAVNTYDAEFEIEWADLTITTVPNEGYKEIAVVPDLA
jgi:hypothetical protein